MRPTLEHRISEVAESLVGEYVEMVEAEDLFRLAFIRAALKHSDQNRSRAARRLGIHRNTLLNELRRRRG